MAGKDWEESGSRTETALLRFAHECGVYAGDVRAAARVLRIFTFTSSRKRMSVLVARGDADVSLRGLDADMGSNSVVVSDGAAQPSYRAGSSSSAIVADGVSSRTSADVSNGTAPRGTSARLYTKGAAEVILSLCTTVATPTPTGLVRRPLPPSVSTQLLESLTSAGLRVLALAARDVEVDARGVAAAENLEKELTLVGLVGLQDPLRREVVESVEAC